MNNSNSILRYDGIYSSPDENNENTFHAMRFCSDGTYLRATLQGDPRKAIVWLKKGDYEKNPYRNVGVFQELNGIVTGETVQFWDKKPPVRNKFDAILECITNLRFGT